LLTTCLFGSTCCELFDANFSMHFSIFCTSVYFLKVISKFLNLIFLGQNTFLFLFFGLKIWIHFFCIVGEYLSPDGELSSSIYSFEVFKVQKTLSSSPKLKCTYNFLIVRKISFQGFNSAFTILWPIKHKDPYQGKNLINNWIYSLLY